MYKIILDENIPLSFCNDLKVLGYDVIHIGDIHGGITDDEVLDICHKENALLITQDTDFGTLLYFAQGVALPYALILIRYTHYDNRYLLKQKVLGFLPHVLQGYCYTITIHHIRKRSLG